MVYFWTLNSILNSILCRDGPLEFPTLPFSLTSLYQFFNLFHSSPCIQPSPIAVLSMFPLSLLMLSSLQLGFGIIQQTSPLLRHFPYPTRAPTPPSEYPPCGNPPHPAWALTPDIRVHLCIDTLLIHLEFCSPH